MNLKKIHRVFAEIFLRKHLWQIHFFNDTSHHLPPMDIFSFSLLKWGSLVEGEELENYESKFAKILGNGKAISFGAARMALFSILKSMEVKEGDEVLLPAFTCEVVPLAIKYLGAIPVFVDIDSQSLNMDAYDLKKKITPSSRVVIFQHTFGISSGVEEVLKICRDENLMIVEDCALSFGQDRKGKTLGTFGDASIFSSDWTKPFSTILGGIAYTENEDLKKKLRRIQKEAEAPTKRDVIKLVFQSLTSKILLAPTFYFVGKHLMNILRKLNLYFDFHFDRDDFEVPEGYPCRLSNFQAWMGLKQLERFESNKKLRREMTNRYFEFASTRNLKDIPLLRFPILIENRDEIVEKYRKYIEIGQWFSSPAFGYTEDLSLLNWKKDCPSAQKIYKKILNFPTHVYEPELQNYCIEIFKEITSSSKVD